MLTQSQVQDSRRVGRQVPDPDKDPDLTHKTHHQKERRVSHQKERQTKPVYHHEHANTNHTPERRITPTITQPTQNPKTKKKNHTTHSRLTNHSTPRLQPTQTHIQSSCSPPISALPSSSSPQLPTLLTTPCYQPLVHILPAATVHTTCSTTHRHCTTTRVYTIARNCTYACLGLATARPQLVFRSLTVATVPRRLATIAYLYRYQPDCCLHTVHMSVCTTVLTHLVIMLNVLGSAPVLTTIYLSHLLCVTPVTCATTSPLRESTHTPCRFHHPYRSLTLAHRVVPPLVVPVPSLAVSGVRLSFMVPLAGESPLADARLPPHPNGHLLLAKRSPTLPSIHTLLLPAPLLYAYMLTFFPALLLTYLPSFLSTSLLATFIQPCQHNAASIVHQIRQSPQPPVQHICTHKGGAVCERQRVPSPRVHICSVDMMPEVRVSERQRARPSPARARLVTSGYFD